MLRSDSHQNILTIKEVIANFAYKLAEGGAAANIACATFKEIRDSLAPEVTRQEILGLKTSFKNTSLDDVVTGLNNNGCAKRASGLVAKILNENINSNVLADTNYIVNNKNHFAGINQCLALFTIVQDIDYGLKTINKYLAPLTSADLVKIVKEKNHDKNSLLHIAIHDSDSRRVLAIFQLIAPHDRSEIAQEVNHNEDTLLHLAADKKDNFELLKAILLLIPPADRFSAIIKKDKLNENTILHAITEIEKNFDAVKMVLESLPQENHRWTALNEKNANNESVLSLAIKNLNNKFLQVVADLCPEHKKELAELIQSAQPTASKTSGSFLNKLAEENKDSKKMSEEEVKKTETKKWVMPQIKKTTLNLTKK